MPVLSLAARRAASLQARTALYFQFSVAARFKLAPVPTSAKEVRFLRNCFEKLATLEFFRVDQPGHASHNTFGPHVTVVLNASEQLSQLDPFNGVDPSMKPTYTALRQRQLELGEYLKTVCGLPRFSFVENDELYFLGKVQVPFKHTLAPDAGHLRGGYTLTASTAQAPFVRIDTALDAGTVVAKMRHNFQKFHKMLPLEVHTGMYGIRQLIGALPTASVAVDPNAEVDVAAIMDLDAEVDVEEKPRKQAKLMGLLD